MKKLLSLLLATTMCFALCSIQLVSAQEGTLEIDSEQEGQITLLDSAGENGYYVHNFFTEESAYIPVAEYGSPNEDTKLSKIRGSLLDEPSFAEGNILYDAIERSAGYTKIGTPTGIYSSVCLLITVFTDGYRQYGTGWLINRNYVATAGHVIYKHEHGGWASKVAVYVGESGGPRKQYTVGQAAYAGGEFVSEEGADYDNVGKFDDWGIVRLNNTITADVTLMGYYTTNSPSEMYAYTYETAGYPQYLNQSAHGGDSQTYDMYKTSGSITGETWKALPLSTMDINIASGQSGSPIYRYVSSYHNYCAQAIGIAQEGSTNYGILINQYLVDVFNNKCI